MAQRKTVFTVERISDDSTGMYRMGEIDTDPQDAVKEYVRQYGEFGYQEMLQLAARICEVAQVTIRDERMRGQMAETCAGS